MPTVVCYLQNLDKKYIHHKGKHACGFYRAVFRQ